MDADINRKTNDHLLFGVLCWYQNVLNEIVRVVNEYNMIYDDDDCDDYDDDGNDGDNEILANDDGKIVS